MRLYCQGDGFLDNSIRQANSLHIFLLFNNQNDRDYAYDDNGNITSITKGTTSVTYQYNGANELIRENNEFTQLHDYQ